MKRDVHDMHDVGMVSIRCVQVGGWDWRRGVHGW